MQGSQKHEAQIAFVLLQRDRSSFISCIYFAFAHFSALTVSSNRINVIMDYF